MMVALDRSAGLLEIAQGQGGVREECVRGDLCGDAFRRDLFVRHRVFPCPLII